MDGIALDEAAIRGRRHGLLTIFDLSKIVPVVPANEVVEESRKGRTIDMVKGVV